jgi:hypothetical protein
MTKFTATFRFEKETKNTFRYQEEAASGQPPKIGSLYVQKWAVPGKPEVLTVTVSDEAVK